MEKQLTREAEYNRAQIQIDSDKLQALPSTDLVDRIILGQDIKADEGTVMSDEEALGRIKHLRSYWASHR